MGELTATVPAKLNPTLPGDTYPGTAAITVSQLGSSTAPVLFGVTDPRPTLATISPTSALAGGAGISLMINGKGFANGAVAIWNGTVLTTTFVSDTELTATVPASLLTTPGTFYVIVLNPATGGGSAGLSFIVKVTSIGLKTGTPTRNPTTQAITLPITITNTGHDPAPAVAITVASLGVWQQRAPCQITSEISTPASRLQQPCRSQDRQARRELRPRYRFRAHSGGSFSATTSVKLP